MLNLNIIFFWHMLKIRNLPGTPPPGPPLGALEHAPQTSPSDGKARIWGERLRRTSFLLLKISVLLFHFGLLAPLLMRLNSLNFYIAGSSELGHEQTTGGCTRETALRRGAVRFGRHARSRGDVLEGDRICFRIRRRAHVQRCARCQRKRCRHRWRRCVVVFTANRVAT